MQVTFGLLDVRPQQSVHQLDGGLQLPYVQLLQVDALGQPDEALPVLEPVLCGDHSLRVHSLRHASCLERGRGYFLPLQRQPEQLSTSSKLHPTRPRQTARNFAVQELRGAGRGAERRTLQRNPSLHDRVLGTCIGP